MEALAELSPASMGNALFYAFAALTVAAAITVVASRNIIRAAVGLLFALLGVAGLYFLLNAEFLAAVQLVVYVGGTLILIIFGVMLTSTSPFSRLEPKLGEVVIGLTAGAVLLVALLMAFDSAMPVVGSSEPPAGRYPMDLLGRALLGDYLAPFELVSVLLLVVMIGAAYLARGRRREVGSANVSRALSTRAKEWS